MPRKILATVIETYCPECGAFINMRSEEDQSDHHINCWGCNQRIFMHSGYGERNTHVYVEVKGKQKQIRFTYVWQQKP